MLSGSGGDEGATYNGANLYAAAFRQGYFVHTLNELRARARLDGLSLARVFYRRLVLPLMPPRARALVQRLRQGRAERPVPRAILEFLAPALAHQVSAALINERRGDNGQQDRILNFTESYLVGRTNNWSIVGAHYGIAFTFPLLDRRIIDFTLSLPVNRILDGGFSRQPFRNAMGGILPEAIRWRTTKYVPAPDMPVNLARAKAGLLAQVEALRAVPAATAFADLDAIAAAIRCAPEGAEAERAVLHLNAYGPVSPSFSRAMGAVHALSLAHHAAGLSTNR
jgi:asparagine synthase (glutamine-hydrolysing)